MLKKIIRIILIVLLLIVLIGGISLMVYKHQRDEAEKAINQSISNYGIPKKEIKWEKYPYFTLDLPKGFYKTLSMKSDSKDNYYIFHYDPDTKKVDMSGIVGGNDVSIHDKLFKKLRYQPSKKFLKDNS